MLTLKQTKQKPIAHAHPRILSSYMVQTELYEACIHRIMLEVAMHQVCMSVSCMLHAFLKYSSNIVVAACNYDTV